MAEKTTSKEFLYITYKGGKVKTREGKYEIIIFPEIWR
jgi:hypothetical protein